MASRCELRTLLDRLGDLLHELLPYDFILAFLVDAERGVARLLSVAASHETRLRSEGLELPIEGTNTGLVFTTQSPLVVGDIETGLPRQPPSVAVLREHQV